LPRPYLDVISRLKSRDYGGGAVPDRKAEADQEAKAAEAERAVQATADEAALDRELEYARRITQFIQENEDDSAQQERWRVFVRRDTALNEVKKVHNDVCEKLEDFQFQFGKQLERLSAGLVEALESQAPTATPRFQTRDGTFQQKQLSAPEYPLPGTAWLR